MTQDKGGIDETHEVIDIAMDEAYSVGDSD
jgi:hypothetical protein